MVLSEEFVIERVSGGLNLHPVDREPCSGFTTICDDSTEKNAFQALATLVSDNQMVGVDWWDIVGNSSPVMEFKTHTVGIECCVSDSMKWFDFLKSEIDFHNVRIISIYGDIGMIDVNEIINALIGFTKNDNNLVVSFVVPDKETSDVKLSLWLNSET